MFASKDHHYTIAGELDYFCSTFLNDQVRYPRQSTIENERDFTPHYIQSLQAGRVRRRSQCVEKGGL